MRIEPVTYMVENSKSGRRLLVSLHMRVDEVIDGMKAVLRKLEKEEGFEVGEMIVRELSISEWFDELSIESELIKNIPFYEHIPFIYLRERDKKERKKKTKMRLKRNPKHPFRFLSEGEYVSRVICPIKGRHVP